MTASLTLSAFGQMVASTGGSTSAYQFGATSGYRTEGDAGLTLVGCRSYDAQVGRFITRDTFLDQKPYAYCEGDPINATDPSGHWVKRRFWYWAGVTLIVVAEVLGTIAVAPSGIGIVGGVLAITGTVMWAYGGDPGGRFW